eukprot:51914_1
MFSKKSSKRDHNRYQSTVVHLPQHIDQNSEYLEETKDEEYLSLKTSKDSKSNRNKNIMHANAKSIAVVDELAQYLQLEEEPHPICDCIDHKKLHSPKIQTSLLWFSIALFAVSMIISTMFLAQKSLIIVYIIQLSTAIVGLILSYFYNVNMHFTYNLNSKLETLLKQTKQIHADAIELEKELENEKQKAEENDKDEHISLLQSFRSGNFHKQLKYAQNKEIKELLPVIAQTIVSLPFGLTQFRSNLFIILANRISTDPYLDQSWRFFLNSYGDLPIILRTWENHEYLNDNNDEKHEQDNIINAVQWFDCLFNELNQNGQIKQNNSNEYLCDPINGNPLESVQLKEIIQSNNKPYLIDCYTFNNVLSSTLILKKGSDLRKDLSVILMFKYFNQLFKENNVMYNGIQCKIKTFEVVPMGFNFGCIEFIKNAYKMENIDEIITKDNNRLINILIASGAASFIGAYILGVRDRDNILISIDGTLFHNGFSHILGEDTEKIAISNKFVEILGNEKWNQFIDVVAQCFTVLRNNYVQILDYARIVFGFMQRTDENETFLKQSLFVHVKQEMEALNAIKTIFNNAPSQIKSFSVVMNL